MSDFLLHGKLLLIPQSQVHLLEVVSDSRQLAISLLMFPQQFIHIIIIELIRWNRSYFFTPPPSTRCSTRL